MRKIVGLEGVTIEATDAVAQALERTDAGMDSADALRVARAADCTALLTFDRKLAKRARGRMGPAVEVV